MSRSVLLATSVGLALVVACTMVFFARGAAGALTDPVLLAAGDIATAAGTGDTATAQILRATPGTVATLGDNAYNSGSLADYRKHYDPTWGTEKVRTRPVPGNHEYVVGTTKQYGAGYFDYFGAAAQKANAGSYSYGLGEWRVVALNTGQCYGTTEADGTKPRCGPGDPMIRWLESVLATNPKACTLVYAHHPRFSSGEHGNATSVTKEIYRLLYKHGAEVYLSGHDHDYERFAPQNPSGARDDARGVRQFVVGTGGAELYPFGAAKANSQYRNNATFGALKLTLRSGAYDWRFLPTKAGANTDSGSGECH